MEKIGVIVPTRGERSQFLGRCHQYIKSQTRQPDRIFYIDFRPRNEKPDLTLRIRLGVAKAIEAGMDQIFIMEDDDFYPSDYLEKMEMPTEAIVAGCAWHWYYHIGNQRYELHMRPRRSALFLTGFRPQALHGFEWPANEEVFLDDKLWQYFTELNQRIHAPYLAPLADNIPIGIKHGLGLCGGAGHYMTEGHQDENYTWLKQKIGEENAAWYQLVKIAQ